MNVKKALAAVVLAAIVVGSITWTVVRLRPDSSEPQWLLDKPAEMIDPSSGIIYTKSRGEWEKLKNRDGYFKNPDTGEYTLRKVIVCVGCGEKIPAPPFPSKETEAKGEAAVMAEIEQYQCPKCGRFPLRR